MAAVKEFTVDEVAAHNTEKDLWIIVHGEVYDVTKYVRDHPGGDDILVEIGGLDGSEEFDAAGHSEDAWDITRSLHVGTLKKDENRKQKRSQTARLIQTTPAPAPVKEKKSSGSGRAILTLSLGLGSAVGAWWYTKRFDLAAIPNLPNAVNFATEWLRSAGTVKRVGFGFTEGVLVTTAAFSVTMGLALQRLGYILQYYSFHKAHKKIPRLPVRNLLNGRGWLDPNVFQKLPLVKKETLSADSFRYVFALPRSDMMVGLPIGQHVSIRGEVDGKLVSRSYTPTSNNADRGVLELVIKCYPNGALTHGYLEKLEVGDLVEFRGPKGGIRYVPGMAEKIGMVAGGTGITPMYQLIRAICENPRDMTEVSLIYANKTETDILLRKELDDFARKYPGNFKIYYVLEQTPKAWIGGTGYVTKEMMKERFAAPSSTTKVFLCGPPPMVDSAKKSLNTLGFGQASASPKPGDSVLCF